MPQILWFVDQVINTNIFPFGHSTKRSGLILWGLYTCTRRVVESNSTHHGYHHLFFSKGEGETVSFNSKQSHSFVSVALILLASLLTLVT